MTSVLIKGLIWWQSPTLATSLEPFLQRRVSEEKAEAENVMGKVSPQNMVFNRFIRVTTRNILKEKFWLVIAQLR